MAEPSLFCQVNTAATRPSGNGKETRTRDHRTSNYKGRTALAVTIKVGEALHVMENGHFIQFVDLYSGHIYISRVDFTAELNKPEVTLTIVLPHEGKENSAGIQPLQPSWNLGRNKRGGRH